MVYIFQLFCRFKKHMCRCLGCLAGLVVNAQAIHCSLGLIPSISM